MNNMKIRCDLYGYQRAKERACDCQEDVGIDLKTGKCMECGKQIITRKQAERRREKLRNSRDYMGLFSPRKRR